MSSANDAKKSEMIIRFWNILNCHVISSVPAVDTEVAPPQQFSPTNVDQPILTHCKKPCASARDSSVCAVSLPNDRCAHGLR